MIGLGIALAAGVYAVFFGDAFFTGQWWFMGADPADPDDKGLPISACLSSISVSISWSSVRS
jgi:multicomponent Na+:H+ antiporter subunit B